MKISLSRDSHAALWALINKSRLLNGWTTRTAKELDATIRTWFEIFTAYGIQSGVYDVLYRRAFDVRQSKLQQGSQPPAMDATLLVSQWTGENGLQAEIRRREIESRTMLPENAASQCQLCFGAGFRQKEGFDYQGGYVVTVKCDHNNNTVSENG